MISLLDRFWEEAERIITLKQYGERVFMPTKAVTCSENTRASFQGMLNKNIYPVLGDRKLIDITSADITSLLVAYQAKGRKHASVVKMYTVLRLLFGMAYNADVIERNPMNKVERPKPRKDESRNTEIQAYTADELRSIINALDGEPLKWRTIMRLIIDTGIRRGECCGLRWQDIDFDNNLITINGTLGYTAERGIFYNTPKNGKSRVIDVDASIMKMLKEMRAEQVSTVMSEYVFTQECSAEPMHPQSPARYMQKFGERNGIEKLHPHKLRHSFASVAITNNADIASVSEKLGHTDKATTLRMYTHADTESMKRASNIFRDALKLEEKRA